MKRGISKQTRVTYLKEKSLPATTLHFLQLLRYPKRTSSLHFVIKSQAECLCYQSSFTLVMIGSYWHTIIFCLLQIRAATASFRWFSPPCFACTLIGTQSFLNCPDYFLLFILPTPTEISSVTEFPSQMHCIDNSPELLKRKQSYFL